jgi:EAL domain-containing protein (putative c-di-GMP-specific phosphodiesterase class I)/AmiR/NasT family two-component response regulator
MEKLTRADGLRFLVVEDQGFQRWAVEQMLRGMGAAEVYSAADGKEALDIVRGGRSIDVIVTDLNMPGMDGIEFIRHVGQLGSHASFLLVSAQEPSLIASVAAMTEAYGGRLVDTIHKPVNAQKLGAAIERYRKPQESSGAVPAYTIAEIDAAVRRGEIEPYFQGKISLATLEVVGAEALARWRHPLNGIVKPAGFVGQLESGGSMEALTLMMLERSTRACRTWREAGFGAKVSVNISLTSLVDVMLADRMDELVARSGLGPPDVILEITETAAASHLGRVLENLSRLRMKGFGLSIDDFGTGYASMQQLSRIPFTELKVDQSFVRAAPTGGSSRAVLESSLEIARKMRIDAVAEGVESEEQVELLRKLGCPLVQGNHLMEPLPADEFLARLKGRPAAQASQA